MRTFELLKIAISQGNKDGSALFLDPDTINAETICWEDTDYDGEAFAITFNGFEFESEDQTELIKEVYLASFWQAVEEHQGIDHAV